MQNKAATRNLILPAEVFNREFDARVLQALIAVGRGWDVVVGSKAHINRNIWRFRPGVYLCQTLTSKRLTMLNYLDRLGFCAVGWCEEGFVYPGKDLYLKRRISSQTLDRLDALIAWGESNRDDIKLKASDAGLEPQPLGNPRIDLLRPEFRALYRQDVENIKSRFGSYILFNSNFANVNPAPEISGGKFHQGVDPELARQYDKFVQYRRQIFQEFQKIIPTLAERFSDKTIVIRPHPSENPRFWQQFAEQYPNIAVVRENTAIPWLIGADAIIHNGCTTAAEAALLDKSPIAYCPIVDPELEHVLSNEISLRTTEPGELISRIEESFAQRLSLSESQQRRLDYFAASRKGDLASTRIQDLFDEVYEQPREKHISSVRSDLTRGLAFGRYCYKSARVGHKTDRYLPSVFPHKDVAYVQQRSKAIAACLGMQDGFRVTQVTNNIFQYSAH